MNIIDLNERRDLVNAGDPEPAPPGRNCATCAYWRIPEEGGEVRALIEADRAEVDEGLRKKLNDEEALDRARAMAGDEPVLATCHYNPEAPRALFDKVKMLAHSGPSWFSDMAGARHLIPETSPEDNQDCPTWRQKEE